jgi:hypothetical protein
MKKFRINTNENEGFQMDFLNGVTVSVQFGGWTRSDKGETTAEVAVFRDDDWFIADVNKQDLVKVDGSDVMTSCTPEVVAWIMDKARHIK